MKNNYYDTKHIKVLDGIRALAILIIVWFHFWQQNWIIPKIGPISLDFIPRYGYLFVDMMILLSSFCLFIPYARSMVYKEELPDTKKFYIKRIARIFPSYYFSLIVAFIFLIIFKDDWYNAFFVKDTLTHLFFVNNWSSDIVAYSNYLTVLWTVALEVQFYLIFPFIAKRFVKKPKLTYSLMMIIGIVSIFIINKKINSLNIGFYVNHFLTFIPVYANGMLACWFYVSYTKNKKRSDSNDLFFTIISIFMVMVYVYLVKNIGVRNAQQWQLDYRVLLSFVFMVFIISTALSARIYQKFFTNKVMKFICTISFNLYIYHQFIAVKLKEFRIPYFSGGTPPNITGDTAWKWKYTIICIIVSFVIAIIVTYLLEKPMAKFIKRKFKCE